MFATVGNLAFRNKSCKSSDKNFSQHLLYFSSRGRAINSHASNLHIPDSIYVGRQRIAVVVNGGVDCRPEIRVVRETVFVGM